MASQREHHREMLKKKALEDLKRDLQRQQNKTTERQEAAVVDEAQVQSQAKALLFAPSTSLSFGNVPIDESIMDDVSVTNNNNDNNNDNYPIEINKNPNQFKTLLQTKKLTAKMQEEERQENELLEKDLELIAENMAETELEHEENSSYVYCLELFFMFVVIFCLYFPDIWDFCDFPETDDIYRNIALLICFVIFVLEMIFLSFHDTNYYGSLFFSLDLVGTLSIILELTWIDFFIHHSGRAPTILRVTRVTKLAVRSKEMYKLFIASTRMVRLYRPLVTHITNYTGQRLKSLVKQHSFSSHHSHHHQQQHTSTALFSSTSSMQQQELSATTTAATQRLASQDEEPLYTSKQLVTLDRIQAKTREVNEAFAFRVAGICMILCIIIPFLQNSSVDNSPSAWITYMKMIGKDSNATEYTVSNLFRKMEHYYHPKDIHLYSVYFESPYFNHTWQEEYIFHEVRSDALGEYDSSYSIPNTILLSQPNYVLEHPFLDPLGSTSFQVKATFDMSPDIILTAAFSMLTTTLVILVIFFGTSIITDICYDTLICPLTDVLLYDLDQEELFQAELAKNHDLLEQQQKQQEKQQQKQQEGQGKPGYSHGHSHRNNWKASSPTAYISDKLSSLFSFYGWSSINHNVLNNPSNQSMKAAPLTGANRFGGVNHIPTHEESLSSEDDDSIKVDRAHHINNVEEQEEEESSVLMLNDPLDDGNGYKAEPMGHKLVRTNAKRFKDGEVQGTGKGADIV